MNWQALVNVISVIDKSNTSKGGRKPLPFEWKVKMLFLKYAFNLSDEELEDQLIFRLSSYSPGEMIDLGEFSFNPQTQKYELIIRDVIYTKE